VLDVGCGPGQWSSFLADQGKDVDGFDPVPEFVEHARVRFPNVPFRVAGTKDLPVAAGSAAGILCWYSLIHTEPAEMPHVLEELAGKLEPGGALLLGFFEGARVEQFPHAVAPAYFWPVASLEELLRGAGFDVVSVAGRTEAGARPHAAISARLRH
jgi:SAM-dependent methyltransferase